jgi:hypothetical protein
VAVVGSLAAVGGCGADAGAAAAAAVDSATPRSEAMRRFAAGLAPVDSLAGPSDRDVLVERLVRSVAARDTAGVRALILDRAEFAHLFYPTTPQGLPPYDVSPALMWELLTRQSDAGVRDAFRLLGGRELRLVSHDCGAEPAVEGENRIWGPCAIVLEVAPAAPATRPDTIAPRLTGPIIERGGRYKFVSLTNDLD